MKTILILLTLVIFSKDCMALPPFPGDKGNGSYGIKCYDKPLVTLDYFEGEIFYPNKNFLVPANDIQENITSILQKIKDIDPALGKRAFEISQEFGKISNWKTNEISPTFDTYHKFIKQADQEKCTYIPLIQNLNKVLTINNKYYTELKTLLLQQVIISLHEIFYQIGVETYHHTSSLKTRRLAYKLVEKGLSIKKIKSELKRFAEDFSKKKNGKIFNKSLLSVYKLDMQTIGSDNICPRSIYIDYAGDDELYFMLASPYDGNSQHVYSFHVPIDSKGYIQETNFNTRFFNHHNHTTLLIYQNLNPGLVKNVHVFRYAKSCDFSQISLSMSTPEQAFDKTELFEPVFVNHGSSISVNPTMISRLQWLSKEVHHVCEYKKDKEVTTPAQGIVDILTLMNQIGLNNN